MYIIGARSAVCLAALVAGNAAFADVTAQEVWDNWKSQMSVYGQDSVTFGSEDYDDGVLTVTDMTINMTDQGSTVAATMDNITLTENGDGTVTVTYSEEYPISFSDSTTPEQNTMTILLKSVGNEMIVSGTAAEMAYDLSADRFNVQVTQAVKDGQPMPLSANMNINDVAGTYNVTTGDTLRDTTYDMTAASIDYLFSFTEGVDGFDISSQIANIAMEGSTSMPIDYDPAAPEAMFVNGFAIDGTYTTGLTNLIANMTSATGPQNITATSQTGNFGFGMSKEGFSFDYALADLVANSTGSQSPFPIDLTAKTIGIGMTMPASKTDAPAPFSAKLDLVEVNTNDMIWSMADPTGALPHDPITAQIDLSGEGKLYYDIFDPAQTAEMEAAAVPGELNSLALNSLNLVLGGATVTGAGAFTFDNTDLVTFGGMPRPQGSLDLQAKGVNGLLDKLQAMGLVPEDQMMGARMMLGMFATVVGDDELTSKLEVNEAGGVLVNGQQIR